MSLSLSAALDNITTLWLRSPALLYGVLSISGAALALHPNLWPFFLVVFAIIGLTLRNWKKMLYSLALASVIGCLTFQQYHVPVYLDAPVTGIATFDINNLKTSKSSFGEARIYRGTLHSFVSEDTGALVAKNIPISVSEPMEVPLKPVDRVYRIHGRLRATPQGRFTLAPDKSRDWEPIQLHSTLAQWRYDTKNSFQEILTAHISDPHVAAFLSGIAVGEFDDMQLSFELGKLGLQHLMAISGLHFSIIAGILAVIFGSLFGKRTAAISIVVMLTAYFLLLGYSPSVLRAWIAILLMLAAYFVQRRNRGLNSLGIGLMAIALLDPLSISSIPFQFSFGVTASILLWFEPCDALLEKVLSIRSLSKITTMHWIDQHFYCIVYYLRHAFALTLAVNLAALPITLFYFHQFPLMGLFYNLFFPFLVSFSMLLLLIGIPLLSLLPPLGQLIMNINEQYTGFLLDFVFNLPKKLNTTWVVDELGALFVLCWVLCIFTIGMMTKRGQEEEFV